jgi:hypothetical protein
VTYHTAFVIELHTRRVRVLGSTPHPDGAFLVHAVRVLLVETDEVLREGRIPICDRDPSGTSAMEDVLKTVGVRVLRTPAASPNCNQGIGNELIDRRLGSQQWGPFDGVNGSAAFLVTTIAQPLEWARRRFGTVRGRRW